MTAIKAKPTKPALNDQLIAEWYFAHEALQDAKIVEATLRANVVQSFFMDAPVGTSHFDSSFGDVACVKALSYKLAAADEVVAMQASLTGILENELICRLVKWKPELSVSEYKQLSPEAVKIVDKVLTITPAMPSLKLTAAKK